MAKCLLSKNSFIQSFLLNLSNGPDKKCNGHVGMQKDANFTAVSTMLLIGLNCEFLKSS